MPASNMTAADPFGLQRSRSSSGRDLHCCAGQGRICPGRLFTAQRQYANHPNALISGTSVRRSAMRMCLFCMQLFRGTCRVRTVFLHACPSDRCSERDCTIADLPRRSADVPSFSSRPDTPVRCTSLPSGQLTTRRSSAEYGAGRDGKRVTAEAQATLLQGRCGPICVPVPNVFARQAVSCDNTIM